jgi:hypothetical protein
MTLRQNRVFAATGVPHKVKTATLIAAVKSIVAAGEGNPLLPARSPPLLALAAAVTALDEAETAAGSRTIGTVAPRNDARRRVLVALAVYKELVQAEADANPEQAESVIVRSGLRTRRPTTRRKRPFTARSGKVSGSIRLGVLAASRRASYEWGWSLDGGKTWSGHRTTLQTTTTIRGLPVGKFVVFRVRPVTKAGAGDWMDAITVLVV